MPLIGALWIAEMASAFESAMILAALKVLIAEFGDPARVGWLITGFLLTSTVTAALIGRLGDLRGRRLCLLIVLATGAAGSLISAFATSFELVLAGRLLQGTTGAILPLAIGLVRENLPDRHVPAGIGLMISGASVGTAAGLVVGGLIVDHGGWQGIFLASAGFCAVAWIAVRLFVPLSRPSGVTRRVDWLSGILFAPAVTLILAYVSLSKSGGWIEPTHLALFAGGLTLLLWWGWQSLRSANPLIDIRSFANRTVAVGSLVTALVAMSTLQIIVFFSLLMQAPTWTIAGLGLSATAAGLAKLPSNLSSTLAAPLGGWLTGRGGGRLAMVTGGIITTIGWSLVLVDANSLGIIIGEMMLISFGSAMLFAVAPTIIAQASPPERVSEISGLVGVIRGLFLGIGAQMVSVLLATDSIRQGGETYPSPAAYQLAVSVIVAICVLAILLSLALPGRGSSTANAR